MSYGLGNEADVVIQPLAPSAPARDEIDSDSNDCDTDSGEIVQRLVPLAKRASRASLDDSETAHRILVMKWTSDYDACKQKPPRKVDRAHHYWDYSEQEGVPRVDKQWLLDM